MRTYPSLLKETPEMTDHDAASPARPDRILRLPAVLDRTGLSRSAVYRRIRDGTFPRQVALGARSAGWRESAVNKWIEDPMAFGSEE